YWRPLIRGINDTDAHIEKAAQLSNFAHATAFTGLFLREEIRAHLRGLGLEDVYADVARRKVMPQELERRILSRSKASKLFRKTSCAVAHAWSTHDYNGHVGLPDLCDICPPEQVRRCKAAFVRPKLEEVLRLASIAGLDVEAVTVEDDRIFVSNSSEEQRYFLQHSLNFQVHDRAHPHTPGRHGRAEIGWTT
ncbi:MAG TPA: radical SAM protein, partial [Hyphomonas adhaerens]|nr:radical SAM protein [Hyphomonas adhaerens]